MVTSVSLMTSMLRLVDRPEALTLGNVFHAGTFNARGLFQRVGGWLAQNPSAGVGTRLTDLLQRAHQALFHVDQAVLFERAALAQFAAFSSRLALTSGRARGSSPLVSATLIHLSSSLAALRAVQNEAWRLVCVASGVANAPSSITDGIKALGKGQGSGKHAWSREVPQPLRDLLTRYWKEHGAALVHYRDIDQHFDVVQTGCVLTLEEGKIVSLAIVLPDNPEEKSSRRYTYGRGVSGVTFARTAFERLHELVEDVAGYHNGVPAPLHTPSVMRPPLVVADVPKGGLAALLLLDYDGREGVAIEKRDEDGRLTLRNVFVGDRA